ncbi:hypothetical protein KUH03_26960 [Sphingobacterium sp. E70]|uniref:hypothetical protein n=1 Tax=Sphingobacterium sp. E70 TaxID=2853439 RepID=UPI00211B97C7|nr:hypothetical protein [Sphingobacterium sp. E70]ULT22905.1 hypothetical protein KUH03_26960 [Sphingobacterium sp. E70]
MQKNSFSDISTTGGQMARILGLGLASKLYKQNRNLDYLSYFSNRGNEVTFCTIGNAATSEGVFLKSSMLPEYIRFQRLFLFGMMVTESRYRMRPRPQKVIFLKY